MSGAYILLWLAGAVLVGWLIVWWRDQGRKLDAAIEDVLNNPWDWDERYGTHLPPDPDERAKYEAQLEQQSEHGPDDRNQGATQ